jgi:hypothetical protein
MEASQESLGGEGQSADQPEEQVDQEITVTGTRKGKDVEPFPSISINVTGGGTFDWQDLLPPSLREFFELETDFDLDENFSPEVESAIRKEINGLARHPETAAAFKEMLKKGADIDIKPWIRDKTDDYSKIVAQFLPDGTLLPGST